MKVRNCPRAGVALVGGMTGAGKSLLLDEIATEFSGTRVVLVPRPVPHWQETGSLGEFYPDEGAPQFDVSLEEVLTQRPAGLFIFACDTPSHLPQGTVDPNVIEFLASTIPDTLAHRSPGSEKTALHLLLDDGLGPLAAHRAFAPICMQGRALGVTVTVAAQDIAEFPRDLRANARHWCLFRHQREAASWDYSAPSKLSQLSAGQYYFRDLNRPATSAELCKARLPEKPSVVLGY